MDLYLRLNFIYRNRRDSSEASRTTKHIAWCTVYWWKKLLNENSN